MTRATTASSCRPLESSRWGVDSGRGGGEGRGGEGRGEGEGEGEGGEGRAPQFLEWVVLVGTAGLREQVGATALQRVRAGAKMRLCCKIESALRHSTCLQVVVLALHFPTHKHRHTDKRLRRMFDLAPCISHPIWATSAPK